MTDDEVNDYVEHLRAHLPPSFRRLEAEQIRAVLDAEATYFERRFGPVRGWRALLRSIFGRGDPSPEAIEEARPEFEAYVVQALSGRNDLTRADIRAIMQVEVDAGPLWSPPPPTAATPANDGDSAAQHSDPA